MQYNLMVKVTKHININIDATDPKAAIDAFYGHLSTKGLLDGLCEVIYITPVEAQYAHPTKVPG